MNMDGLREQHADHNPVPGVKVRRASLNNQPTNQRTKAGQTAATTDDVFEDPYASDGDFQEPSRMPTNARKYQYPAPVRQPQAAPPPAKRRIHPLIYIGIALFIMLAG